MAYYLCSQDGNIITDGDGLLDIRIDVEDEPRPCPDYFEKCCAVKDKQTKPILPPVQIREGCGNRNQDGIGFRITGDKDNEAQYGEFPWMIAVLKEEQAISQVLNVYQCGEYPNLWSFILISILKKKVIGFVHQKKVSI